MTAGLTASELRQFEALSRKLADQARVEDISR
jgi:hypothetical protein